MADLEGLVLSLQSGADFYRFVMVQLAFSAGSFIPGPRVKVPDKVVLEVSPFSLEDVRLLDGLCREAMLRDQKYLLDLPFWPSE
ncbi:MAG: hypothetical protein LAP85_19900 [Acidobacteriia bacterium]|nr:hypothetical protein [Terriglobia bacterium]